MLLGVALFGDSQDRGLLGASLGFGHLLGFPLLGLGLLGLGLLGLGFWVLLLGLLRVPRRGGVGLLDDSLPTQGVPREPRDDGILQLADLDASVLHSLRLKFLSQVQRTLESLLGELAQPLEQPLLSLVIVLRVDVILVKRALLTRPKVVDGADPPLRALLTGANLLLPLSLFVLPALLILGGGFLGFLRLGHDRFIVVRVAAEAVVRCFHGRGVVLGLGVREHGGFRLCDFLLHLGQSLELGLRVRPSLLHNRRHARRLFLHPVLLWRARNYSAHFRPGRFLLLIPLLLLPLILGLLRVPRMGGVGLLDDS